MNQGLLAAGFLALAVAIVAGLGAILAHRWGLPLARAALEAYWSERWNAAESRLQELELQAERLPRVWEEFAKDAKKAQDRARWHVRRVKQELQERGLQDDEINLLDGTLREADGEGGNGSGLSDLQGPLATVPEIPPSPIEIALNRKWNR